LTPTVTLTGTTTSTPTYTVTQTATPNNDLGMAVDCPSLSWYTGGYADWTVSTVTTYYNGSAAQSGTIYDSQSSYMYTMVNFSGYKTLSFYWKVSSEASYDYLTFYIDGQEADSISGNVDWDQDTFLLAPGQHTLEWEYAKDESISELQDTGWVDDVQFIDITPTFTPTITQTFTATQTGTITQTVTITQTLTLTPAVSPTNTGTITMTYSSTPTYTTTQYVSPTATVTNTILLTITPTVTPTSTPVLDIYEPDDNFSMAQQILSGVEQTHSIMPAGDIDCVMFNVTTTSNVTLETSGTSESDDTVMELYSFNSVSGLYSFITDDDDGGNYLYSKITTILNPGTYYAMVYDYNTEDTITQYYLDLTVNILPTPTCTNTISMTSTITITPSLTATQTYTATLTNTPTTTFTVTPTVTQTSTFTPTQTATPTKSNTITQTSTPTSTATIYITFTSTLTATQTPSYGNITFQNAVVSGTDSDVYTYTENIDVGSGAHRALVVGCQLEIQFPSTITATYGGVSMNYTANGGSQLYIFTLLNPPAGNNAVVITWTGASGGCILGAIAYNGVGAIGNVGGDYLGDGTRIAMNATTSQVDSWIVAFWGYDDPTAFTQPSYTERLNSTTSDLAMACEDESFGPANTYTFYYTQADGTSNRPYVELIQFVPTLTATVTPTRTRTFITTPTITSTVTMTVTGTNTATQTPSYGNITFQNAVVSGTDSDVYTYTENIDVGNGAHRALVVGCQLEIQFPSTITATYGGVSMNYTANGGSQLYIFTLLNPPAGNNAVVITWTGASGGCILGAIAYNGVGAIGNIGGDYLGDGTRIAMNATTSQVDSWIVAFWGYDDPTAFTQPSYTERLNSTTSDLAMACEDESFGPANTYTFYYTQADGTSNRPYVELIQFVPTLTATVTPTRTRTFITTPTITSTVTMTVTGTNTATATLTPTTTRTWTSSITPTITLTRTKTVTPTITATGTETFTGTQTNTFTPTYTITSTSSVTQTTTMTFTTTSTPTATETSCAMWQSVGNPGFSGVIQQTISFSIYNGTPYFAFQDYSDGNRATVMMYNGTSWVNVGYPDFSAESASFLNLYVYNGTAYVAYNDSTNSNKATVMMYNGSNWVYIGSPGFSAGEADNVSMYVYNGTPYVAYQDFGNSAKITVMMYNGINWINVGNSGFSASVASFITLKVSNGTPYVAFQDSSNSAKATVMMFNGSNWVNVGSPGFSGSEADYLSMYIYNGVPYVAYSDAANSGKATVMMFNGTAWSNVGNADFSAGTTYYESLYVFSGIPYVAYLDYANSAKATVMMYDGTNWVYVGIPGFSVASAPYTSLYIYNGIPYVAYIDWGNSNKATVMEFVCPDGDGMSMASAFKEKITPTPTAVITYQTLSKNDVYCYPNPNQGETTIRFTLANAQDIHLIIVDINGKRVWTHDINSQNTVAGINKIIWNDVNDSGQPVANGVYLFIVQAGNKIVQKEIAVIR
jgi:hypothetical protein